MATNMNEMFYGAVEFNQDIGDWNVSKVAFMYGMFYGANSFNQDISSWDTSLVTDMSSMFFGTSFNQDIGDWDTSKVKNMSGMFQGNTVFNQDIGDWNISSVSNFDNMLISTPLSISNYDSHLIGLDATSTKESLRIDADTSSYCQGEDAREALTTDYRAWTIDDNNKNCNYYINSSNKADVESGTTSVITVTKSTIDDSQTTTYSIVGGTDGGEFSIDSSSGELSFTQAPNYSNPSDANLDNIYRVQVKAIDTDGSEDIQTIKVKVTPTENSQNIVSIISYLLF